jgi:hypothetical protein
MRRIGMPWPIDESVRRLVGGAMKRRGTLTWSEAAADTAPGGCVTAAGGRVAAAALRAAAGCTRNRRH